MGGGLIYDMNELRWILLIIGIAVLAVIYVLGRKEQLRRRRRRREEADTPEDAAGVTLDTRAENEEFGPSPGRFASAEHFDELPRVRTERPRMVAEDQAEAESPVTAPPAFGEFNAPPVERPRPSRTSARAAVVRQPLPQDKLITLFVVARRPSVLRGDAIRRAAESAGLEYGEMQVFHRIVERNGRRLIVFSLANAVQPGTFDLDEMHQLNTPGLALFMQLPGPLEGLKTFNAMLDCAQHLAVELDAGLRDEARNELSNQTIDYLREEIQLFSLRTARSRAP